jgi:hypothetical protein
MFIVNRRGLSPALEEYGQELFNLRRQRTGQSGGAEKTPAYEKFTLGSARLCNRSQASALIGLYGFFQSLDSLYRERKLR